MVGRVLLLLTFGTLLTAGAQPPPSAAAGLPERFIAALKLHQAGRYAEAATILEPYQAPGPAGMDWHWNVAMYQLARDQALVGRKEKAIKTLMDSQAGGSSVSAEQLQADTDLASLRDDARFKHVVEVAQNRERIWGREPGQDVPYSAELSDEAKIAGLATLWAEARFNFAFFERQPDLDWNQLFVDYLPKVRAAGSTEEYYRVLIRFAALLKDGHTNVYPPQDLLDAFYGGPGLRTQLVESTVVVTDIEDPALRSKGWRVGDGILKIDGEDARLYAEREVAPYQSSSTQQDLDVRAFDYGLLSGRAGSQIRVTVVNAEGTQEERILTRRTPEDLSKLKSAPGAAFTMRPDGIAVLTIDEFEDAQGTAALREKLPLVSSSKGLVIDIRANGGGSTPVDLLQILSRRPIRGPLMRTLSYRAADRARGVLPGWTDSPAFQVPADPRLHVDVPVAVLTSARTFSAAEDFVALFNSMHRGITVGETTAGSTGQPLFFQLPGGGSARICTRNDRAPDGTAFEGVGLRPTITVVPTVDSIRRNTDLALERAAAALLARAH